jgi:tyrosinase
VVSSLLFAFVTQPGTGLATLRRRQSVDELNDSGLTGLRRGFLAMEALNDDRGYGHWAGIHGLPLPMYCQHGNLLFMPWHRAYLYFFEQYLLDQVPDAGLPWWDWTTQAGIPGSYGAAQLADGTANPLATGPVTGIPQQQFDQAGLQAVQVTSRQPDDPSGLPSPVQVSDVLTAADFIDFTTRLEDIHNGVHVWVGGTMGLIPLAAYDPIFWAHHAMIDRLWYLWQLAHPGAGPDASLLDTVLAPFTMTVRQTFDIATLGYDYAAAVSSATPAGS